VEKGGSGWGRRTRWGKRRSDNKNDAEKKVVNELELTSWKAVERASERGREPGTGYPSPSSDPPKNTESA